MVSTTRALQGIAVTRWSSCVRPVAETYLMRDYKTRLRFAGDDEVAQVAIVVLDVTLPSG